LKSIWAWTSDEEEYITLFTESGNFGVSIIPKEILVIDVVVVGGGVVDLLLIFLLIAAGHQDRCFNPCLVTVLDNAVASIVVNQNKNFFFFFLFFIFLFFFRKTFFK
jgi:hypothetical protein